MMHRPSLMIDEAEERMDRIIAERTRIKAERDEAGRIIEAFEADH
jgi:hypothetical protein